MCMSSSSVYNLILKTASLSQILLSRFIINLRRVNSPEAITATTRHPSQLSTPNFRMPTMDDVVDNLGEPLDFVEYRLDDEDDGQNVGVDARKTLEQQDAVGTSKATAVSDSEAAGPSGSGSVDAEALETQGIDLDEVCFIFPRSQRSTF